jgi:hypothetical protein
MSGYWIICVMSYEYEGVEISQGRMKYHYSTRPVISKKWRRATQKEIETQKYHNGIYYNLNLTQ